MLALGQCLSLGEKVVWRSLTNDETVIAGSQVISSAETVGECCAIVRMAHRIKTKRWAEVLTLWNTLFLLLSLGIDSSYNRENCASALPLGLFRASLCRT